MSRFIKQIGKFRFSVGKYKAVKNKLPMIIGNEAANHFKQGFREGGKQTDESKSGWQPRKVNTGRQRAILVKTGDLRDSIDVITATFRKIIVGTSGIIYARRHNEGLNGMTKREFIGDSKELNKKIKKIITDEINLVFK